MYTVHGRGANLMVEEPIWQRSNIGTDKYAA